MPRSQQPQFEEAGGHRLPLGGINGYLGVRGKQGRNKDKFQGCSPNKKHRTRHCDTPLEAAIAFAQMKEDLELGMLEQRAAKTPATPATTAAAKKPEVGTYLGYLLRPPPPAVVPRVACALLNRQQAGDAVARGVPVAYAELIS